MRLSALLTRSAGALVLALLLSACNLSQNRAAAAGTLGPDASIEGTVNAPDFPQGAQWLNVDAPLSLSQLRGKFVLLDFWTYCCINCMHIIPDLKKLEEEFPDELVVIGVHSAKFDNEQETGNIRSAILRYDIEHPVINDADMAVWSAYTVRSWPTVVLIDPQGKIVGQRSGEGVYDAVQPLLKQAVEQYDKRGLLDRGSKLELRLEKEGRPDEWLAFPGKLDADAAGRRLVVSDSGHNRILLLAEDGTVLQVIGHGVAGLLNGDLDSAQFNHPQGVCFSADAQKIYVADTENHSIRVIDLKQRSVSTLAGTGQQAAQYPPVPGRGTTVALSSPWDLLLQGSTLYVAMAGSHQIWTIDINSGEARPYAGSGREDIEDGPAASAALAQTSGLSAGATSSSVIYFADSETSSLRELDAGGKAEVKTLIGEGLFDFGDIDGRYPTARLQHPIGVHYSDGSVYVADTYNHKVRRYDLGSGELSTLAGTGQPGSNDGLAAGAMLNEPNDIADLGGRLYIADTNNGLIRIYDPATQRLSTLNVHLAKSAAGAADAAAKQQDTGADAAAAMKPGRPLPLPDRTLTLSPVSVGENTRSIRIQAQLPAGMHFNAEAPSQVSAGLSNFSGLTFQAGRLLNATDRLVEFEIPVRYTRPTIEKPQPGAPTLDLYCYVFFCDTENSGQCFLDSVKLAVPVSAAEYGNDLVYVSYDLVAPAQ